MLVQYIFLLARLWLPVSIDKQEHNNVHFNSPEMRGDSDANVPSINPQKRKNKLLCLSFTAAEQF